MNEKLQQLIYTAQRLNREGINSGTSGNLSIRHNEGFYITPSGKAYEDLTPEDLVFISGDTYRGKHFPSSEWRLHRDIYYQIPEAQVIIHAHPTYCSALASCRKPLPPFHYMVAVGGGKEIPCAQYALFGTQDLSDFTIKYLQNYKAVLMSNHGVVCRAKDIDQAYYIISTVEELAKQYSIACSYGGVSLLSYEEMDAVLNNFKYYGKQEDEILRLGLDPSKNPLVFPKKL